MIDPRFMQRALELASRARGKTRTNPLVGAVLVKDGQVIGEGFHREYGGPHAEVEAIRSASDSVAGSNLYVTLEPCAHSGKTPPCIDIVRESGIGRVIAAMTDPNPLVDGKGLAALKETGIDVIVGVCEQEARRVNEVYLKYITTSLPFVTLKIAQTLDGKIADYRGQSKWITSEESRRRVYELRSEVDAVLIGANTARLDDPALTTHGTSGRNPLRLVLNDRGELSRKLKLFEQGGGSRTVLIVPDSSLVGDGHREKVLPSIETMMVPAVNHRVDLEQMLRELGRREIAHVLVEGGADVFAQFLEQRLCDKVIFVVAPKLLGTGKNAFDTDRSRSLEEHLPLRFDSCERLGDDLWIEAYWRG